MILSPAWGLLLSDTLSWQPDILLKIRSLIALKRTRSCGKLDCLIISPDQELRILGSGSLSFSARYLAKGISINKDA